MKMDQVFVFAVLISVSSAQFLFGHGGPGGMFGNRCAPLHTFCPLQCPEYEKDGSGCDICHCKGGGKTVTLKGPDHSTTQHNIRYPCTPQHSFCQLKCEAFVTGPGGCEYCTCKQVIHNVETTTSAPVTTTTATTTSTTTLQPTTAMPIVAATTISQDCIIAKQICSAKCDGKYLVDPSDCTFCICKSELQSGR